MWCPRVPLTHASLTRAPLTRVPLTHASLTRAPLTRVPLTHASLTRVPLTRVPLTRVPLTRVPLTRVPLHSCAGFPFVHSSTSLDEGAVSPADLFEFCVCVCVCVCVIGVLLPFRHLRLVFGDVWCSVCSVEVCAQKLTLYVCLLHFISCG